MTSIVISQSMYFPWVGMLEQIKLADSYVHYDDVQFARGFYNRVQIKTRGGWQWLTVPLANRRQTSRINEICIDESQNWRCDHLRKLELAYEAAPHSSDMLRIVNDVFTQNFVKLSDLARYSTYKMLEYFDIYDDNKFSSSESLFVNFNSSERLVKICKYFRAKNYITGHGARNYLDHERFEQMNVSVNYMNYKMIEYPQLHGDFNPYVSALDLIANCGVRGREVLISDYENWKTFLE